MKFRYYIADVMSGIVRGTDDRGIADGYAATETDAFVVDTEEGNWLMVDNDEIIEVPVEEAMQADVEEEYPDPSDAAEEDEASHRVSDDPEDSRN